MQIPRKMSAHNVMASITRTLGTRSHSEGKPANEVKFAGEESKDKLYEPKHKQKLVRVLTVVAYIISVSLAAIVLSLYYMYIWDPSDHPHYMAKQRLNTTTTVAATASSTTPSTKTSPCLDVTPAVAPDELVASSSANDRFNGTSSDGTSTPVAPTLRTMDPSQASDNTNPQGSVKSLYKTLTSPSSSSRRDYPDTVVTDQSGLAMPSISSDQFEAAGPDYRDATIEPAADDLMDD